MLQLAGGQFCGGGALEGRVRGLAGRIRFRRAELFWTRTEVEADTPADVAVYHNCRLAALLPPGTEALELPGLAPGAHDFAAEPFPAEHLEPFPLRADGIGGRAVLAWGASPDTDCRAYRIFGGLGAVSYAAPLAEIDAVEAHRRAAWGPDVGGGIGRVRIQGMWSGPAINEEFAVEVTAAGEFRHDAGGGWSESGPFARGVFALAEGLFVEFLDPPALYEVGDLFRFRVGPRAWWVSDVLAGGLWRFAVVAVDAAGNAGATPIPAEDECAVLVIREPAEIEDLAAAYDPDTGQVALSWSIPAGAAYSEIRIYSNHSRTFDLLHAYIIEDAPWATVAGDAMEHTFTPGVSGDWIFVVRPVAGGIEARSLEALEFEWPWPAEARLNDPGALAACATVGGSVLLSWEYRRRPGGEDLEQFAIFMGDDPDDPGFWAAEVDEIGAEAMDTDGIVRQSWASAGGLSGTKYLGVRARGAAEESQNTETTAVIMDTTAPEIGYPIQGAGG